MIDWQELWKELVRIGVKRRTLKNQSDTWYGRADKYRDRVKNRWLMGMDSSRKFVLDTLEKFPDSTVLDIGTGTGDWALMMAEKAQSVTALDTSQSMLDVFAERIHEAGVNNIVALLGEWPVEGLGEFDICFCSHAFYGSEDITTFITELDRAAKKRVIFLVRAPQPDAVMGQAAQMVFGHPYDSPNYQILINILFSLGIFPNVIMEDRGLWKPWLCQSLDEALIDVKQRLGIYEDASFDEEILDLLRNNLTQVEEGFLWPRGVRTALLYWDK